MSFNPSSAFDTIRNLYAKINYSKLFDKTGRAMLPLRYTFELTHECNLKCPYCYLGEDREKIELTAFEWMKVIKQIPFYAFVTITGGEPLLRKDFSDILYATARRTFGKVNVVTNGTLIDDEAIDAFIKSKMLLLSISIDGWGESHNKYRGEGTFEKIIENIEKVTARVKAEKSRLMMDIKTIIMNHNLEDLPKLYQYATNEGFEFFSLSFLRNNNLKQNPILQDTFGRVFYAKNYPIQPYFDLEKFEEVYLEIRKMERYSKTKIRFAPKFDNDNHQDELQLIKKFFTKYLERNPKDIYEPCMYPFSNTIINPMGDIYPCLSYKMGNIKEHKLPDIINNSRYCCFRKNLKYSKLFSSCQMCCEAKVKDI